MEELFRQRRRMISKAQGSVQSGHEGVAHHAVCIHLQQRASAEDITEKNRSGDQQPPKPRQGSVRTLIVHSFHTQKISESRSKTDPDWDFLEIWILGFGISPRFESSSIL